jgi:KDO2-lipid IV(A) lauroyltransferase
MKRLQYLAEYLLLCPLLCLLGLLPLSLAYRFMDAMTGLVYACDRRRRATAVDNILRAGVRDTPKAAAALARESYRHFGRLIVESLKSSVILDGPGSEQRIKMCIPPEVDALLDDPDNGVILATGHIGSWEMAAQLVSRRKPVAGVTRNMDNPLVNRWIQRHKPREQFHLVPKRDPRNVGRFLELLGRGEVLALMIDQHAGKRGMIVEFMGRPASTQTSIPLLHLISHMPLCFGWCKRVGDSNYELRAVGPFMVDATGDKQKDIAQILGLLNAELEKAIREAPEQYMWGHRRWRED